MNLEFFSLLEVSGILFWGGLVFGYYLIGIFLHFRRTPYRVLKELGVPDSEMDKEFKNFLFPDALDSLAIASVTTIVATVALLFVSPEPTWVHVVTSVVATLTMILNRGSRRDTTYSVEILIDSEERTSHDIYPKKIAWIYLATLCILYGNLLLRVIAIVTGQSL